MQPKYFEQLSSAYLAHFCRRLADLIIEQSSEIIAEMNLITPTTAISTVFFLQNNNDVTVATLANALGVSHQMATQRINTLEKLGLISRATLPEDKRAKTVVLTPLGQSEVDALNPLIQQITEAFDDLERELDCELTKTIRQAELSLLKTPLKKRLASKR